MRTEDDPNMQVDWDTFEGIDRHAKQRETVESMKDVIPVRTLLFSRFVSIT